MFAQTYISYGLRTINICVMLTRIKYSNTWKRKDNINNFARTMIILTQYKACISIAWGRLLKPYQLGSGKLKAFVKIYVTLPCSTIYVSVLSSAHYQMHPILSTGYTNKMTGACNELRVGEVDVGARELILPEQVSD